MEKCLERLKLYLSENGVAYEVQHHRAVLTSQKLAAELHEKGRQSYPDQHAGLPAAC